jgi:hypothetical protein
VVIGIQDPIKAFEAKPLSTLGIGVDVIPTFIKESPILMEMI